MITKTEAIVLHSLKYGDTSLIVRVFTREMGIQSYLVKGVRKPKSRIRQNLFQPLTIIRIEAYHKASDQLQHIREVQIGEVFHTIHDDITKTSIAVFLAEVLAKSLKNQEQNTPLFDFIKESILFLDQTTGRIADFHLVFLIRLSRFLGIEPRNNYDSKHRYFNLREGVYQGLPGGGEEIISEELSKNFHALSQARPDTSGHLKISPLHRRELLEHTIRYFRYHLDGMQEIKSHTILAMVLREKT